jgi:hypothetical protein
MDVCKARALAYLTLVSGRRGKFTKASSVGGKIWPGVSFSAQGAGAAASRVLKALERDGLVKWTTDGRDWGWEAIRK